MTETFSDAPLRRSARKPKDRLLEEERPAKQPAQGTTPSEDRIELPSTSTGQSADVRGTYGDSGRFVHLLGEIAAQPWDGEQPGSLAAEEFFAFPSPDGSRALASTTPSLSQIPIDPSLISENATVPVSDVLFFTGLNLIL